MDDARLPDQSAVKMFDVAYDPADRLIICTVSGFLTVEDVRANARALRQIIDRVRRWRGYVRILIRAYDLPVQSLQVTEASSRIGRATLALIDDRDRLAYAFSARLTKMQTMRTIDPRLARSFVSEPEARVWLMEDVS